MASPNNIVFLVVDNTNTPVTGLSLVFATYKDFTGTNLTNPPITEIGSGFYEFIPDFYTNTGICYIVNTGYNPAVIYGYARPEDFGIDVGSPHAIVFLVVDNTNTPVTGLSLAFTTYEDNTGTPVTQPPIAEIDSSGFYEFIVSFPSDSVGISYLIDTGETPVLIYGYTRPEDYDVVIPEVAQLPITTQPVLFQNTTIDYGQDTYDLTDLPSIDIQVLGLQNLGLRLARRLTTPYGALGAFNDDADFGYDVYQLINAQFSGNDIMTAKNNIENELLKEEEVLSATVDITRIAGQDSAYEISIAVQASQGPFQLVLNIGDVTFQKLQILEGPSTTTLIPRRAPISLVDVTPVLTLLSITISPSYASILDVGGTQQYAASGFYSDGSTVDITGVVTWTSDNTARATINSDGLATAGGTGGDTNITADLDDVTSNIAVLHNGSVWAQQTAPSAANLTAVFGYSPTSIWAGTDTGLLIHYNGTAWSSVSSFPTPTRPATSAIEHIHTADGTNIYVCCGYDLVVSNNSGTTWTQVAPNFGIRAHAVWAASGSTAFASLNGTRQYKSTDSGATYTALGGGSNLLNNGPTVKLFGFSTTDVYGVGSSSFGHYNGTWSDNVSMETYNWTSFWGTSTSDGYVGGLNSSAGIIQHSSNSWSSATTQTLPAVTGGTTVPGSVNAIYGGNGVVYAAVNGNGANLHHFYVFRLAASNTWVIDLNYTQSVTNYQAKAIWVDSTGYAVVVGDGGTIWAKG